MKHIIFAITTLGAFFWFSSASALVTISDPQLLLPKVHALHGTLDFDRLFPLNSKAEYFKYQEECEIGCSDPTETNLGGCSIVCKGNEQVITRTVIEKENGMATVHGPEDGFFEQFTPETIRTCGETLVEKFLSNLDQQLNIPGRLVLTKMTNFQFPISEGTARARKVQAYSLYGDYYMDGLKRPLPLKVTFIPDAPGTAQVALFSVINTVYFRVRDY